MASNQMQGSVDENEYAKRLKELMEARRRLATPAEGRNEAPDGQAEALTRGVQAAKSQGLDAFSMTISQLEKLAEDTPEQKAALEKQRSDSTLLAGIAAGGSYLLGSMMGGAAGGAAGGHRGAEAAKGILGEQKKKEEGRDAEKRDIRKMIAKMRMEAAMAPLKQSLKGKSAGSTESKIELEKVKGANDLKEIEAKTKGALSILDAKTKSILAGIDAKGGSERRRDEQKFKALESQLDKKLASKDKDNAAKLQKAMLEMSKKIEMVRLQNQGKVDQIGKKNEGAVAAIGAKNESAESIQGMKGKTAKEIQDAKDKAAFERTKQQGIDALNREKERNKRPFAPKAPAAAKGAGKDKGAAPVALKPAQIEAAGFGRRLEQSESTFQALEKENFDRTDAKTAFKSRMPLEALKPDQVKRQQQAERNFINAVLRKESGASISSDEFSNAEKQYFPRVGDTPEVVAQKRRNREIVIQTMRLAAGPAWDQLPKVDTPPPLKPNPKPNEAATAKKDPKQMTDAELDAELGL